MELVALTILIVVTLIVHLIISLISSRRDSTSLGEEDCTSNVGRTGKGDRALDLGSLTKRMVRFEAGIFGDVRGKNYLFRTTASLQEAAPLTNMRFD